jgi:[ribosomal protein S5]-alanine N-acetyltransferase
MHVWLTSCEVRVWQPSDLESLVRHANNRKIWLNVRDRFPHPYLRAHGQAFIKSAREGGLEHAFAIVVDGAAIGGVGFVQQQDVERVSAEIGYWLGEAFWGRGIATEAVIAVTRHAIDEHRFTRLFATTFAHNIASARVLEKAGYTLDARLRRSAIKDGQIIDELLYGFTA